MLIEFSVENFKSFKDKVTFSMVASPDTLLPDNVARRAQGSKYDLLKVAAIYGANASGKSNLISAINFMGDTVLSSHRYKQRILNPPDPFFLDDRFKKKPSTFEAVFLIEGTAYQYGMTLDDEIVHKEWLYSFPKSQRRVLFRRTRRHNQIYFGSHWKGDRKRLQKLAGPGALVLSVAAEQEIPIAFKVRKWITEAFSNMRLRFGTKLAGQYIGQPDSDKIHLLKFLKAADLGIVDVSLKVVDIRKDPRFQNLDSLANTDDERRVFKVLRDLLEALPEEAKKFTEIQAFHLGRTADGEGKPVIFRPEDESEGTKALLGLAIPFLLALYQGGSIIMDELDEHLHPLLSKWLVNLFQYEEGYNRSAQLIFTTHDSSLLDQDIFRRDQVWFTEKNPETGATDLYSLWDFKKTPRKTENIRGGYLAGRYGAVPFIGSLAG